MSVATSRQGWIQALPRLKRLFREKAEHGQFPLWSSDQLNEARQAQLKKMEKSDRQAAVLVLLMDVDNEPSVVLTRRSKQLRQHAHEIALPGGHVDPEDASVRDAALREFVEELEPTRDVQMHVVGACSPLPSLKGTPVTPLLAVSGLQGIQSSHLSQLFPGNASEVESVFAVSVHLLQRVETSHRLRNNRFGLVLAPCFPTENGNIWGLTAYILRPLLYALLLPSLQPEDAATMDDDENPSDSKDTRPIL